MTARLTRFPRAGRGLVLCLLFWLSVVAVADYASFDSSTIAGSAPFYATDAPIYTSVLWGFPTDPVVIAVGFTFLMPEEYDPTATGAVVDTLTVPFFTTPDGPDPADASFRIVQDASPSTPGLSSPAFDQTLAVFQVASWKSNTSDVDANDSASLTSVSALSSGVFLDGLDYWLLMNASGGDGSSQLDAYWYRAVAGGGTFMTGEIGGTLTSGSGNAPAYAFQFTGVPEPGAAGLLALAGMVGLLRRRRRS